MKTLHLTVTREWFDKILYWEKKEDFRKIKNHWRNRFYESWTDIFKRFDQVIIKNWYSKNAPTIITRFTWIRITWKDEVTDLWTWEYFAIWIGQIVAKFNINK